MKIGKSTTNPGELRSPITLGKRVTAAGAGGFVVGMASFEAFDSDSDVWAKWVNVHGSEVWTAAAVNVSDAATVLIRYDSRIDSTCGIKKGDLWYQVVSVDNIGDRSEYMELKVKRFEAG